MTYSFVLRLFFFLLQSTTLTWGEVLPYLTYTGMCHWTDYGFCALYPKQGV